MFGPKRPSDRPVCVKICGITNAADAFVAIDCGADALGFNFFPGSKRYVDIRANRDWIGGLPANVTRVAVLVNPTRDEAIACAAFPFIDALQLHGKETPAFCKVLADHHVRFAKAIPVVGPDGLGEIPDFFTDTVLLDSSTAGFGGSGEPFPWEIGGRLVERHPELKIILAGGLRPENVTDAIRQVRPFGVDVTTGVESSPGRKDHERLRAFFAAIPRE